MPGFDREILRDRSTRPPSPTERPGCAWPTSLWSSDACRGDYRLGLAADDRGRLFVDGREIITHWKGRAETTSPVDVELGAGRHALRIEFADVALLADLLFWLRPL